MNLRRVALTALVAAVLLFGTAVVGVMVLSVRVEGASMEPTLREGQRLLATPFSGGEVHRFDVVLLRRSGSKALIVKRVIAVPGDRVGIVSTPQDPYQVMLQKGGAGSVYHVTGPDRTQRVRQPGRCCAADGTRSGVAALQTVPPGRFFFLGDNPDASQDARAYGWGRIEEVAGRVGLRVWPLSSPRAIGNRPVLEAATWPGA